MGTVLPVGIPQKNRKDMSCGLLPPDLVHHRPSIPWSLSSPSSWPLPAGQLSPFRFFQAPSGPYHSYLHQTKKNILAPPFCWLVLVMLPPLSFLAIFVAVTFPLSLLVGVDVVPPSPFFPAASPPVVLRRW